MNNYLHNSFSFSFGDSLTTRKALSYFFPSVEVLWNKFTCRYSLVVRLSLDGGDNFCYQ